ncbi:pentatricopeptide repeat-containing protein [Tanacetum coccineum]
MKLTVLLHLFSGDVDDVGDGVKKLSVVELPEMAPSVLDALYFDVHHDGVFVLNPLRYEHGLVYDWKLYKNRKMDYKTMCEFLKEKTDHAGFTALYFCLPECDLEVGLKIIERDSDVAAMYDFADSYGKLNIFMSHIHQNLAEFYFQNLNMEESGDEATSRLRIHEIMVKDASNMSYDELVSWAEDEAEMQTPKKKVVTPKKKVVTPKKKLVEHVVDDVDIPLMNLVESPKLKRKLLVRNSPSPITKRKLMGKGTSPTSYVVNKGKSVLNEGNTVKKAVDKGKSTMVEEANTVKKVVDKGKSRNVRRNNGIVIEDNVNPTVESDTDSESDPGNGINYSMYSDSDSDSEYSDKSVDYLSEGEEELIQLRKRKTEAKNAPKVRKQQTQAANEGTSSGVRQRKQHFVGDNETVIEHEGFMDDLLRKLSQDNGNGMTDPFHIVETKVEKYPIHDVDTHWRMRKPKVGDLFVDIEQLKGCLTYYALANGYSLWFYRSSNTKLIAKCGLRPESKLKNPTLGKQSKFKRYPSEANRSKCRWRCYGKRMTTENSVQVISMHDEHTCARQFKYGTLVSYKWIGRHFGTKIRLNPDIKLHEIADLVLKKYKCIVTPNQCRNAKRWALNEGETTIEDHYGYIRSYAKAILESNPGSTVKVGVTVNPDDKTYFDRFYVCFKGLKDEWKLGCRKIIALYGCFLKRPSVGEILTAIGRDANNHIFPVAWAVVNVENKDNWSWFLDLLGDDLEMPTGQGLTLMSDQHKGLIKAVKEVMPYAEHRQCARHIYEGFRKLYSGVEFRLLFWVAAKATYPGLFNKIMEKIKRANPNAYDYLLKKEPKTWSRAYFHLGTNCEAVENRFSKCFNSVILSVRSKPLITMLEAIRVIVLERMHIMRNLCDKWTVDVCPNIQKRFWHVIPTGGNLFEVRNGSEAFGVDEERRNCSCKLWQLSGLPCCHAIAVIFKLNRMVEDYVPDCYRKQAFYDTYHQYLTPVGGMTFWPDCSDMSRVLLPKKGRPRKTPLVGSSLINEEIETLDVDEQVGVEEQASQYDVRGSSHFDVEGEEQASQYDFGVQRGRRVKTTIKRRGAGYRRSVPSRRFSNLGRWFGLGENAEESDPIENSEMAQETNQNEANDSFAATQETHQFSATTFPSTQNSQNHQV